MLMKDFPKEERPRERFIQYGAESLSNQELIALVLRTGTKEASVLTLAQRVLSHFGNLRMLKEATLEELTKINGIGPAKAIQLLTSIELGRRIVNSTSRGAVCHPDAGGRSQLCNGRNAVFTPGTFCLPLFKYKKSSDS